MIFELPEFASYLWISGFDFRPDDVGRVLEETQHKFPGVQVQIVDLSKVAGSRYLLLATFNAMKSFHSKRPISRTLGMEILLHVAASRQIGEAVKLVGVGPDTATTAALVVGPSRKEVADAGDYLQQIFNRKGRDELIDEWPQERIERVRSTFGIGNKELEATVRKNESPTKAIERLATERSALLTIRK